MSGFLREDDDGVVADFLREEEEVTTGFLREDDDGVADFLRDKEDKLALTVSSIFASASTS